MIGCVQLPKRERLRTGELGLSTRVGTGQKTIFLHEFMAFDQYDDPSRPELPSLASQPSSGTGCLAHMDVLKTAPLERTPSSLHTVVLKGLQPKQRLKAYKLHCSLVCLPSLPSFQGIN